MAPTITRSLSHLPGESHVDHLTRIADQHVHAGTGKSHGEPVHVAAEPYEPTAEDLEAVRVKREASLEKLRPKKRSKL